jgi:type I restriction enzyme S subunit
MKEGWVMKRMDEVCSIARGGSPRPIKDYITNDPNGLNWIKIGDTDMGGKYIYSTKEKILPEGLKKSRWVEEDEFLLSNSMSFGRPYILKTNGCIHDGWLVLRDYQKYLNIDFFYYVLSSEIVQKQFRTKAQGSTVSNLNTDRVASVIIPIPPLSEQQSIVAYLDSAFAKIDTMKANAEKALNEAKALFQASLKEMLEPKEGWEENNLKALTSKIGSGATPKGGRRVYIEEGCHFIRSMNVQYNEFKYDDLAHITDEAANQLNGVEIFENDVLFNITGASIARCCVVPTDVLPARVNQHVSILRLKQEVLPRFLSYIMNSPKHQRELLEIGEAGSTRQALTKTDIENHVICYPSLDNQDKLIYTLDSLKSKVDHLQSNFDKISSECDALKQAILRQVFE